MGKRYDKEFNGYAVKMVVEDGKTMAEGQGNLILLHRPLIDG